MFDKNQSWLDEKEREREEERQYGTWAAWDEEANPVTGHIMSCDCKSRLDQADYERATASWWE